MAGNGRRLLNPLELRFPNGDTATVEASDYWPNEKGQRSTHDESDALPVGYRKNTPEGAWSAEDEAARPSAWAAQRERFGDHPAVLALQAAAVPAAAPVESAPPAPASWSSAGG